MSLERSSFLPIPSRRELKPIPLVARCPAPWDAAYEGGRAQPHLRGYPYNITRQGQSCGQASRLLAAPPPLCRASLPTEPAAQRSWHGAYRLRGLLATREGGPAFPRGPARGCGCSRPRPPGWGYGRCLLTACSMRGVRLKGSLQTPPRGRQATGFGRELSIPGRSRACTPGRTGSIAVLPAPPGCSAPQPALLCHLITQILSPPAVCEENLSASGFPPQRRLASCIALTAIWTAELCLWQSS